MARVIHHPHLQTTMHLSTSDLDWFKIFAAYNETGVTKPEFYTHHLPGLLPHKAKRPTATKFYSHFELMEQLTQNGNLRPAPPQVQSTEVVRVATFSPEALQSVPDLPPSFTEESEDVLSRQVQMTLPNGTRLVFESSNPEQFALALMQSHAEVQR